MRQCLRRRWAKSKSSTRSHGTGTPVLLVPGLGGVGSYWAPNIPAFSSQYCVITHDHRGTGQSSRSRIHYSVDQMSGDLVRLMDHLEISQAHFVGHSTGGAIGQTLAVTNPERLKSLVIYAKLDEGGCFLSPRSRSAPDLAHHLGRRRVRAFDCRISLSGLVGEQENLNLLEQREKVAIAAFPAPKIAASRIDAILDFDRTVDLPRIRAPTLVVCARTHFLTPPYFSPSWRGWYRAPSWRSLRRAAIVHRRPTSKPSTPPC